MSKVEKVMVQGGDHPDMPTLKRLAAEAVHLDKPIKLRLLRSVELKGLAPVTELDIRPMNGADWRVVPVDITDADWDVILTVAGRLSGQPPAVIDQLSTRDVHRVGAVISAFLVGDQTAGDPQSA